MENNAKIAYQEQFVYQGIYRKNTRGRAYLIFKDRDRQRRIVRTSCKIDVRNGQNVTIIGAIRAGRLIPHRVVPRVFPRSARGAKNKAA
ncbi:MAG: hypothetical protein RIF32_09985 [Leptospirales bacterium]|jgi:hypothetical protein